MSFLSGIFASFKLGQELPKAAIYAALGALLMLPFVCGKSVETVYVAGPVQQELVVRVDTLTVRIREATTLSYYFPEYRTDTINAHVDCWDEEVTLAFGNTAVRIDSVNSCKGIYKGIEFRSLPSPELLALIDSLKLAVDSLVTAPPEPLQPSPFGYRVDAFSGASLFDGLVVGVSGKVWFSRVGLFATPRLVIPSLNKSSVDVGLSYRIF